MVHLQSRPPTWSSQPHHLRVTQLQAWVGHRSKNLVAHTAAMAPPSVDLVGHERDQQAQGVRMTSEPLWRRFGITPPEQLSVARTFIVAWSTDMHIQYRMIYVDTSSTQRLCKAHFRSCQELTISITLFSHTL